MPVMDAYETLRTQAAQRRDAAIKAARIEYRQAIRRISQLQHDLAGVVYQQTKPKPAKPKILVELISDVMPRDRTHA